MKKHNTVIMFTDRMEKRTHQTDASIRRYCKGHQACTGWRFLPEKNYWVCVYPTKETS